MRHPPHIGYAIGSKGMVTRVVAAKGMVATGTATKGTHLACSAGVWDQPFSVVWHWMLFVYQPAYIYIYIYI